MKFFAAFARVFLYDRNDNFLDGAYVDRRPSGFQVGHHLTVRRFQFIPVTLKLLREGLPLLPEDVDQCTFCGEITARVRRLWGSGFAESGVERGALRADAAQPPGNGERTRGVRHGIRPLHPAVHEPPKFRIG